MNEELLGALSELMKVRFSALQKPIRKNLVGLTFAFILVLSASARVENARQNTMAKMSTFFIQFHLLSY